MGRGDCPFVAIPVFPSRVFRHGYIFVNKRAGIRSPKDLEGRRVGLPLYTQTASIWVRGHLMHQFGVNIDSIRRVQGAVDTGGSHGIRTRCRSFVRCRSSRTAVVAHSANCSQPARSMPISARASRRRSALTRTWCGSCRIIMLWSAKLYQHERSFRSCISSPSAARSMRQHPVGRH